MLRKGVQEGKKLTLMKLPTDDDLTFTFLPYATIEPKSPKACGNDYFMVDYNEKKGLCIIYDIRDNFKVAQEITS